MESYVKRNLSNMFAGTWVSADAIPMGTCVWGLLRFLSPVFSKIISPTTQNNTDNGIVISQTGKNTLNLPSWVQHASRALEANIFVSKLSGFWKLGMGADKKFHRILAGFEKALNKIWHFLQSLPDVAITRKPLPIMYSSFMAKNY